MNEEKYILDNLRNLLRVCCLDIDGQISREELEKILPIEQNMVKIWLEGDKLFFLIEGDVSFFLLEREGKFNNFDILKRVMFKFNIFAQDSSLFEKNKFQNEILKLLTK